MEWTSLAKDPVVPLRCLHHRRLCRHHRIQPRAPVPNDNGGNELDVLKYWRKTGIDQTPNSCLHRPRTCQPYPCRRNSVSLFESCYIGLVRSPSPRKSGASWSVPPRRTHRPRSPGLRGGHAVPVVGFMAAASPVHQALPNAAQVFGPLTVTKPTPFSPWTSTPEKRPKWLRPQNTPGGSPISDLLAAAHARAAMLRKETPWPAPSKRKKH